MWGIFFRRSACLKIFAIFLHMSFALKNSHIHRCDMIKRSCMNFFRFFQSLVSLKNAKNRICIICDYLSNMAGRGLKIWQKLFLIRSSHVVNARFDFIWGQNLHAYPTRSFYKFSNFRNLNHTFMKKYRKSDKKFNRRDRNLKKINKEEIIELKNCRQLKFHKFINFKIWKFESFEIL